MYLIHSLQLRRLMQMQKQWKKIRCDAGTVLFDPEAEAAYLAEKAYEAGGRKAVILAGAQGDYNHDHRITGFTKKFEELGGKVLDVARCDNPGQGDEKGSNLLSANKDADVAIGAGAGYITSLEGVREKMGLDYKIYGCDTTPNLIQELSMAKQRSSLPVLIQVPGLH